MHVCCYYRLYMRFIVFFNDTATTEIYTLSLHDALPILFLDRLGQSLSRLGRHATSLGVLFLDLDRFKAVNDGLGHAAGDELLRLVAGRLASVLRAGDTAARLGGDEFAALCEAVAEIGRASCR